MNKLFILAALCLSLGACSALTTQETTASNIPTASSLTAMCAAGAAKTPPVRVGACDDFNMISTACQALTSQPLVPAQALAICTAQGYSLTGGFKAL